MRRVILLISGIAIAGSAFALPATCVSATYAVYSGMGFSCQDGDATFSNFSSPLGSTKSGGVPAIPDTQLLVIPGGTTLDPTLTFEYVDSSGNPAPETVSGAQLFSMGFTYQIALTGATMTYIEMGQTFSNTAPGNVSATKNAQLLTGGAIFSSTVDDEGMSNPANTTLFDPTGPEPVSGIGTWSIQDTVSLQAETKSATQNSFENLFTLSETATPEPSTMLLIGSALLCIGLVRRYSGNSERS